jgi:DNA-directed RNA polymerase alpha subunit
MAFGNFCQEETELIKELKRIRLYNPSRLNELIDTNGARPIAEYNFSARIDKCLQLAGITTIEQLAQKTETDLLRIRNLGKTCIKEIKNILSYYGYSLKSEGI